MTATQDEIRVMTSGAFTAAHLELIPQLERLTGKKIVTVTTSIGTGDISIPNRLKRGEGLAGPLAETGIFPRLAVQLVQVGEESGQLEAMLLRVADIYDEEVKRTLQRLLAMLVPVMTICIGIFVAGIIATMLTAILSSYDLSM